jgi:hypothetical protein
MRIAFTYFASSHDRNGQRFETPWDDLCARLGNHRVGEKDGPALAVATFSGPRGNANVTTRTMVAFDVETNPRTGEIPGRFEVVASAFAMRRQAAFLWTTHSHTPDAPRYRVIMPLSAPIPYDAECDPFLTAAAAAQLQFYGLADQSKFGAASLFYLPRHPADALAFQVQKIAGTPIDVGYLLTSATTIAQGVAQDEAQRLAARRAREMPPELMAIIRGYNEAHPIAACLVRYGYRRDGNRWKSPHQSVASQGATTILPDGSTWVSFSESDAAAGVGNRPFKRSSQCACWGDAFGLFCHYEHAGSFRAALDALRSVA